MKPFLLTCCTLLAFTAAITAPAQKPVWQPSPGHTQIPIWPTTVPDAQPTPGPETVEPDNQELVAGKPWFGIKNVSVPTMTIYSPTGNNTGAAIVVFPGGSYEELAIDLEGTEVCDWLTAKGVACILLKYRVPDSGPAYHEDCKCHIHPKACSMPSSFPTRKGM